ncbi:hypothetical protein ACHQM5_004771 [Ranunculus cassubicifolius]
MAEQKKSWNWEVPGFQPRKSVEEDDEIHKLSSSHLVRRFSVSTSPHSSSPVSKKQGLAAKLQTLNHNVKVKLLLTTSNFSIVDCKISSN